MEVHVPASPSAESQEEDDPIIHGDHSEEEEEPRGRHRSDDPPNATQEEGLEHVAGFQEEAAADANGNATPLNLAAPASSVAVASLVPLVDGEEEEGGTDSDMDTEDSGGYDSECSECGTSSHGYRCRSCGGTRGGRGFRCRACGQEPFGYGGDCGSCGQGMLPRAVVCGGCAPGRDDVDLSAASVGCVVCGRGLPAGTDAARRGRR